MGVFRFLMTYVYAQNRVVAHLRLLVGFAYDDMPSNFRHILRTSYITDALS